MNARTWFSQEGAGGTRTSLVTSPDRSGTSTRSALHSTIACWVADITMNGRCDRTKAALIRQTPISQCFTDLHEPVAIPAIHPVAPGVWLSIVMTQPVSASRKPASRQ